MSNETTGNDPPSGSSIRARLVALDEERAVTHAKITLVIHLVKNVLDPSVTVFADAPALRELRVYSNSSTPSPFLLDNIRIPWSQITHFFLRGVVANALEFIKQMSALMVLDLPLAAAAYLPVHPAEPILLSHLITLRCASTSGRDDSLQLFEHLQCPVLEALELRTPVNTDTLLVFLRKYGTGLRSLTLSDFSVFPHGLSILSTVPSITTLRLENCKHAASLSFVIRSLAQPTAPTGALLPSLLNLEVTVELPEIEILPDAVMKLLAKRKAAAGTTAPLSRFSFAVVEQYSHGRHWNDRLSTEQLGRLCEKGRELGCKIDVRAPRLLRGDSASDWVCTKLGSGRIVGPNPVF
uniref:F-box domain-containing protein n=1 Tax=Mycena chlorophos TaxID=658473 RepID=A0ABQ0LJT3_MYCCL|nr:predicted protein [Mycena chlorophos]